MNTDPKVTSPMSIRLTKEDSRALNALADHFGETKRDVIKRGLFLLHYITFNGKSEQEKISS
jgi:predicted DNA-binding protein